MDTYYMHPQYVKWRQHNKKNARHVYIYKTCSLHAEVLTEMLFARCKLN